MCAIYETVRSGKRNERKPKCGTEYSPSRTVQKTCVWNLEHVTEYNRRANVERLVAGLTPEHTLEMRASDLQNVG